MQSFLIPFYLSLDAPPNRKEFEFLQICTAQEAKNLLVGEAWYYWSEPENRFERWVFFSNHFSRTAKGLDQHSVWKFMDESNLLALGEGENAQLWGLHKHKNMPFMFLESLDKKKVLQFFRLQHPSLEFYTQLDRKEAYLEAYEKLVAPIRADETALWKSLLTTSLMFVAGAIAIPFIDKKNAVFATCFVLLLGVGMFVLNWNDYKQKKSALRKKAGLIPAYQNPKIKL